MLWRLTHFSDLTSCEDSKDEDGKEREALDEEGKAVMQQRARQLS